MPSVGDALHDASRRLAPIAGEDARIEAEVLLAHALSTDRAHVLAALHDDMPAEAQVTFEAALARRLAREPLAYIVGHREFYGIDILCEPGALIPRPETEMLVDLALDFIDERGDAISIVDVGTGSGAIAVAVAVNRPRVRILAIEASEDALRVAERNIRHHGVVDRVRLQQADLLAGQGVFDLILANLPYISSDEWLTLEPEIREHEPRTSLLGGERGTEVIERLLADAPDHIAPAGMLAAEIGETQGAALLEVARRSFPEAQAYVMKDFAGRDRVLVIRAERGRVG